MQKTLTRQNYLNSIILFSQAIQNKILRNNSMFDQGKDHIYNGKSENTKHIQLYFGEQTLFKAIPQFH